MRAGMVRAHVLSLLERLIGATQVSPVDDGDYPVRQPVVLLVQDNLAPD